MHRKKNCGRGNSNGAAQQATFVGWHLAWTVKKNSQVHKHFTPLRSSGIHHLAAQTQTSKVAHLGAGSLATHQETCGSLVAHRETNHVALLRATMMSPVTSGNVLTIDNPEVG